MNIRAAGATDIGRRRKINEDSFGVFPELGLFIVADGMGGHAAGEVASRLAVDTVKDCIEATAGADVSLSPGYDPALSAVENRLLFAIRLANSKIFEKSQENPSERGMGTTIVSALVEDGIIYLAHVGDSRIYMHRGAGLKRLTKDHSYVQELVSAGTISPEQARKHPMRNIITRALGTKEDVEADITAVTAVPGEVILLCSDGLTGMLNDTELESALRDFSRDLEACLAYLIESANSKGGDDNITAVLIKITN